MNALSGQPVWQKPIGTGSGYRSTSSAVGR